MTVTIVVPSGRAYAQRRGKKRTYTRGKSLGVVNGQLTVSFNDGSTLSSPMFRRLEFWVSSEVDRNLHSGRVTCARETFEYLRVVVEKRRVLNEIRWDFHFKFEST